MLNTLILANTLAQHRRPGFQVQKEIRRAGVLGEPRFFNRKIRATPETGRRFLSQQLICRNANIVLGVDATSRCSWSTNLMPSPNKPTFPFALEACSY